MKHYWLILIVVLVVSVPLIAEDSENFMRADRPIKGEYIVILDRSIPEAAVANVSRALAKSHAGRLRRVMSSAANGFSVEMTEASARALSKNPQVLLVEENGYVETSLYVSTPNWHLDRIDQVSGTDGRYTYCETGTGVTVYVVDTGVAKSHSEFIKSDGASRVLEGVSFSMDSFASTNPCGGFTGTEDLARTYNAGHGTSVASLIAGNTVGVAKGATIVPVKVASCPPPNHGPLDNIVITTEHLCWGLDWIRSRNNPYRDRRPALVNISLFKPSTDPLVASFEHVINGLILTDYDLASGRPPWDGITIVTSANNKDGTACDYSPSRMAYGNSSYTLAHVISVGGTRRSDVRWDCSHPPAGTTDTCSSNDPGSNYGMCVDIYAPAHDINSATIKSATSYRERYIGRSGTSFSSAIVTGVAARLLQRNPWLTPVGVWNALRSSSVMLANPGDPHAVGSIPFIQSIPDQPCDQMP